MLRIKIPLKDEYKTALKSIIEAKEINISQLSRKVNVAKSTIHKIAKKLMEEGLIEYEKMGKKYQLKGKTIAKLLIRI